MNLTSAGSTEMGEMRYHPFGTARFSSGTVSTRRQYTGQIHDLETGLYFYNARYYDPAIGHFVQADTIIPNAADTRAFDRYAYVLNNPVKYNDPTGHCPTCIAALIYGTKVIDYGWTAYDVMGSVGTVLNPNASESEKLSATGNIAITVLSETAEPDEFLPIGLPIDDLARHGAMAAIGTEGVQQVTGAVGTQIQRVANFASRKLAASHFLKHARGLVENLGEYLPARNKLRPDMPEFRNASEYVEAAVSFMNGPLREGVMQGIRGRDNALIRFDPSTGYFGVLSKDGIIKTFFRPDGNLEQQLEYFLGEIMP